MADSVNRWKICTMKLADLKVSPENPRTITNRNFAGLLSSVKRFGQVEPIVFNEKTNRIVGGHQRFRTLVESGKVDAMVLVVNMSEEEESAANLTLNNPAIEGEWDDPALDLLAQLEDADKALFRDLNLDILRKSIEKDNNAPSRMTGNNDSPLLTKCPVCEHEWEISTEDVSLDEKLSGNNA